MTTVKQCFAMNFRHGTSIMHMDPRHGPLSDKSDPPPSQFAGYSPDKLLLKAGFAVAAATHLQNSLAILLIGGQTAAMH